MLTYPRSLVWLPCALVTLSKESSVFHRPGGGLVHLSEDELIRDTSERHRRCDFGILDANDPDFQSSLRSATHKPALILNLIDSWSNSESWRPELSLPPVSVVKPWNFTEPFDPQCDKDCTWSSQWSPSQYGDVASYFHIFNDRFKSRELSTVAATAETIEVDTFHEPNAIIFQPHLSDEQVGFPTPDVFRTPEAEKRRKLRHVALGAFGTSHGLHRHMEAWQAQIRGFKSWYMLPSWLYTSPRDETTTQPPFGFPHEDAVQQANSICGYSPKLDLVRKNLFFCVQGPGEVVYVPLHWWHATCNLDNISVGTGGGLENWQHRKTGDEVEVEFINHFALLLNIFFVKDADEEMDMGTLDPRQARRIVSYPGHRFRFKSEGHVVEEIVVSSSTTSPIYIGHIASDLQREF